MTEIIFLHGMFQNPASWARWVDRFQDLGYRCLAPAWPLHEGHPATLRENPPAGLGQLELREVVNRVEQVVRHFEAPVVIGH